MCNNTLQLPPPSTEYQSYREAYNALPVPLRLWALENHNKGHCSERVRIRTIDSRGGISTPRLYRFIDYGFSWSDTRQGHEFWSNIKYHLEIGSRTIDMEHLKELDLSNR